MEGIKQSISFETENNKEKFEEHSKKLDDMQKLFNDLNGKTEAIQNNSQFKVNSSGTSSNEKRSTDILMCFDSNGKYIDRKKLWKLENSVYRRCSNIYEVSKLIDDEKNITKLNYILLSIGVNDLDDKDHEQVFGEMEGLINKIRCKYEDIN